MIWDKVVITHPNNRRYVEETFRQQAIDSIFGVEIRLSESTPERKTEVVWEPPAGDRFCEYGPEDEEWMRPLGIGTRTVDHGPLFYLLDKSFLRFDWSIPLIREPRYLVKTIV